MSDLLGIQLAWRLYSHCSILEGILMDSPADYYSSISRNAFSGSENCTLQRLVHFPGKKSTDLAPVASMLLLHASRDQWLPLTRPAQEMTQERSHEVQLKTDKTPKENMKKLSW